MSKLTIQTRYGFRFKIRKEDTAALHAFGAWRHSEASNPYVSTADLNIQKDGPVITVDEQNKWHFSAKIGSLGTVREFEMLDAKNGELFASGDLVREVEEAFAVFLNSVTTPTVFRNPNFWKRKSLILNVLP